MADNSVITYRACSKCGVEKPATAEFFDSPKERGVRKMRAFCRECLNARTRAYRAENPGKAAEWDRRNQERNRGAGSDYEKRRYARRDKITAREDLKRWKEENPDKARAIEVARNERVKAQRRSDASVKEKLNKKSREWAAKKRRSDPEFRAKSNAKNREWHRDNREKIRPYQRAWAARLRESDLEYRIICSLRRRVHKALKGASKSESVSLLLGCSLDEARAFIEQRFQPGMTWENWGRGWGGAREWHLDHVRPLASFDLTNPEQLAQACHYTNLQPLWAGENLAKGAR